MVEIIQVIGTYIVVPHSCAGVIMTEEQATKLLIENEWCTFSDARELLLEAAAIGAKETMESIEPELRRLHAENEALKLQITSLRTPLTTDQKLRIALDCNMRVRTGSGAVKYATAIEAAHGIGKSIP